MFHKNAYDKEKIIMQNLKKNKEEDRVCITFSIEQKRMLIQLSEEERKSYSAILRDGFDLYCQRYIEKKEVLTNSGLL